MSRNTDVDVLVVGAGVSGIGVACHVAREHPERSIAILERRDAIGGTWDLLRYPGIRYDSDMYTWCNTQDLLLDWLALRLLPVDDGHLEFSRPGTDDERADRPAPALASRR